MPVSDVSIKDLVRSGILRPGQRLIRIGSDEVAVVTDTGALKYAGQLFASPTSAANRATGSHVNGWKVWRLTDKDGGQRLSDLREAYRRSDGGDG